MNPVSNASRQIYQNQQNGQRTILNGNNFEQTRINNQGMSFQPSSTVTPTNSRSLINSQAVFRPNQANTPSVNLNTYATTDSILSQALPETLLTTDGWHSELVEGSEPVLNQTETNFNGNFVENNDNYSVLSSSDAPPIIFASTDEVNRIINQASSTKILPSISVSSSGMNSNTSNDISEYGNLPANYCESQQLQQQNQRVVTRDQQYSTATIENRESPPQPPMVVRKKLANDTVTYTQNVSVRYLQPPTPPPPGPIIIREVCPPPPPPQSPIQVRQRPPPPPTPPPIVIRARPPPIPPRLPPQVIEKLLPPPPRPPRRLIVERYAECPPKPADVIIERWLPYRRSDRRRIFFEKVPGPYMPPREPNLLVVHDQPNARVHKEFINEGVLRVDPQYYLQHYGHEIDSSNVRSQFGHLVDEASRNVPPPPIPQPLPPTIDYRNQPPYPSYPTEYPHASSSFISNMWDKMRSLSFQSQPSMYSYDYSRHYAPPLPDMNRLNSYQSYNNHQYPGGDNRAIVGLTPTWNSNHSSPYSRSLLPSYDFSTAPAPPSQPPARTIQVNSDNELRYVLSDLTNGRVPSPFL